MKVLQQMRQAIREQKYRISSHANDEMADDFLEATDIENIIFTGKIAQRFTHDPRGTRYDGQQTRLCSLPFPGVRHSPGNHSVCGRKEVERYDRR